MKHIALLPLIALLLPTAHAAGPGAANDFHGKRVLILGIDGLLPSALRAAEAPHLHSLLANGTTTFTAHTGGDLGTPTQQATLSGPGWTTMLTGKYMDVHGVEGNTNAPYDGPKGYQVTKAPHFAHFIKQSHPQANIASIASWGWIEDYLVAAQPALFGYHVKGVGKDYPTKDRDVSDKSIAYLSSADPDVLFIHFDQVDGMGHATGFSEQNPKYMASISAVDSHVGAILGTLAQRPQYKLEDWLIIVSTDHGGTTGGAHGGQSPEERTIFINVSGGTTEKGKEIQTSPGIHVIPTIALNHLGVPLKPEWGLSPVGLTGKK